MNNKNNLSEININFCNNNYMNISRLNKDKEYITLYRKINLLEKKNIILKNSQKMLNDLLFESGIKTIEDLKHVIICFNRNN